MKVHPFLPNLMRDIVISCAQFLSTVLLDPLSNLNHPKTSDVQHAPFVSYIHLSSPCVPLWVVMGALDGGPQYHLSGLRNGDVPLLFLEMSLSI